MPNRCLWCCEDILNHKDATVFIGRRIHKKCRKPMLAAMKRAGWVAAS